MEISLKHKSSEWSQTNYEYNITGDITLGDIINKANEYNHKCDIYIKDGIDWDKFVRLNKHIEYKNISNDFIDKYKNNKVDNVELFVTTNYDEIIKVRFIIQNLYYHY